MGMKQSLAKKASWAVFWNSLTIPLRATLSLASSVVVVRALGTERYALYALVISTVATLLAFGGLGLDVSIQKFIPEIYKSHRKQGSIVFLKNIILGRLCIFSGIGIILNLFPSLFANIFSLGTPDRFLLLVISLVALIQALSTSFQALLTATFDRKSTNLNDLIVSILGPSLTIVAALLGLGVKGILIAIIASESVGLLLNLNASRRVMSAMDDIDTSEFNFGHIARRWLSFCGFTYYEKLTRYLISPPFIILLLAQFLDKTDVAIFALAADFVIRFQSLLLSPTYGVFMPLFATTYSDDDDRRLQRAFPLAIKFLALVFIPAGTGLLVISKNLILLVYPHAFSGSIVLAQILIAFLFLDAVISSSVVAMLHSYEKYRPVIVSRVLSLAAIGLMFFIIPNFGVIGVTVLYGASCLLTSLFLLAITPRYLKLDFPREFVLKVLAVSLILGLILKFVAVRLEISFLSTAAIIVLGAALFVALFRVVGGLAHEDKEMITRAIPSLEPVMRLL